jgi:DNA-binding CsgD family transcriptional regulator
MVTPPQEGVDGSPRFALLETLRSFASTRLIAAGEGPEVWAAAADWQTEVAERVSAGFATAPSEPAAAWWMDAEHDNLREGLRWAHANDRQMALRLALAMAPWWALRGRYHEGRQQVADAVAGLEEPAQRLAEAQVWIGWTSMHCTDFAATIEICGRVIAAHEPDRPTVDVVDALNCVAGAYLNVARWADAADTAQRALHGAQQIGYQTGEAFACVVLAAIAIYEGDFAGTLRWAQSANRHDSAAISGYTDRWRRLVLGDGLLYTGDALSADGVLRELLAMCRAVGDRFMAGSTLNSVAETCLGLDQLDEAGAFAAESLTIFAELNDLLMLTDALQLAALCGMTRRPADAARLQAAIWTLLGRIGAGPNVHDDELRARVERQVAAALSPAELESATTAGRAMTVEASVSLAHELLSDPQPRPDGDARSVLSPRERELLGLLAEGLTDKEISERLFISIRTVRSHLDRIRDKTGCRRRAELTRLALARTRSAPLDYQARRTCDSGLEAARSLVDVRQRNIDVPILVGVAIDDLEADHPPHRQLSAVAVLVPHPQGERGRVDHLLALLPVRDLGTVLVVAQGVNERPLALQPA